MGKLRTAAELAKSRTRLGYNSIEDSTRRRTTTKRTSNEGYVLTARKREIASATVREDRRNFTLLAWMVRRHLDNVSRFTPHFRVPGATDEAKALTRITNRLLYWHGKRRNFDALGRHSRDEWMRYFEACKIIGGDCGGVKVQGGKMQGIEPDRIAKPAAIDSKAVSQNVQNSVTDSGIAFNEAGQRVAFMVCKRTPDGTSLEFERMVPADLMEFDGYWPERFDADRGVSPLLTALNEGADVREVWEWHILKVKAAGIFGFAFKREGSDEMLPTQGETLESDGASADEGTSYSQQVANGIKARGILNLDLDPGDDVHAIESSSPNPQIVPFTRELIRCVLLALDIPFTFYDSLTASFSARIADRNEYEESCEWKRDKNSDVLDGIYGGWLFTVWATANLFGFGDALRKAKIEPEEAGAMLRWVPAGRPWLDRTNEMSGHILALTAGVTSTPRICATYGDDAYDIAEEQREYLERAGQPLLYANGGQQAVQAIMAGMAPAKRADEKPADDVDEDDNEGAK